MPAGVGSSTIAANSASKIMALIMDTDPLNNTQNNNTGTSIGRVMPDVNGVRNYIRASSVSSILNGHSMDNVLKELGVKAHFMQFIRQRTSGLDNYPTKPFLPTSN